MDLKRETTVAVNVVPIDSELAENWRRGAEEKRKQGLRSRMLEEAEDSARKNAAVAMHWADLFTIDVPQVQILVASLHEEDGSLLQAMLCDLWHA